jgi:hypothetical protein
MYDLSVKECMYKVTETRGNRKITVKHFFRLPTLQDWADYFKGVSELGLSRGRESFEVSDSLQAKNLGLWERLSLRVEGYVIDGVELMEKGNWKELVPLPHKLQAVSGFMTTWRKEDDIEEDVVLDLGSDDIEVRLIVLQNVKDEETQEDVMTQHELLFHFTTPDTADYKLMSKLQSKMRLTRTRERNVSSISIPTDITPYAKLFDKLVVSVDGYLYNGVNVMEQDNWRDLIDAFHKREAIGDLFTSEFAEDEEKN